MVSSPDQTSSAPRSPQSARPYEVSAGLRNFIWVAIFIGVITLAVGLGVNRERTLYSFVTSLFYFLSLALGGLFFTALMYVVKAGWSVTVRRISESFTAFLPIAGILSLVYAILGAPHIYRWLNPEIVAHDELLQAKHAYLNYGFFIVRVVVFFAIWILFAKKIVGNSLKQDKDGNESWTESSLKFSIIFIILFAFSYSLFSVDFLMSIDPHWYSTIFGVYAFAGMFQSTMAFMILAAIYLIKCGVLKDVVNENHLHDLGKLLFCFTIFYAYIAFSQFMLIWYANIPEETEFYLHRAQGSWMAVSYSLLVLKFIVPFLFLLPRQIKRDFGALTAASILILIMQYVDDYWLVYPNLSDKAPQFSFYEIGIYIGFLGLFLAAFTRFLAKHPTYPVRDPRLQEALHHHT